jgi:TPR repeat protein
VTILREAETTMTFLRYAVVALMLTSAPVAAQDFGAGLEAATKGDFATALREWRPLAEQGYPGAQYNLGVMYQEGNGVVQDYAEAVRWYRLAAEQGIAYAQKGLGDMYAKGDGVLQDYGSAHMWYNIAAANGYEDARENRDIVADRMTADAIAEAQQRARTCMASNYQDCD